MTSRSFLVFVLGLLVLAAPGVARSQPAPSDASAHHRAGVSYAKSGKWAEAVRELKESYKLDPTPIRLYDVAQACLQAKQYVEARDAYAKIVDSAALSPEQRKRVRDGLAVAASSIGRLRVVLEDARPGDLVTVDGAPARPGVVEVAPGGHVVRLTRNESVILEKTVDAPSGAERTVVLGAASSPTPAPAGGGAVAERPPPSPRPRIQVAGAILSGLAMAAIGTGAYLWVTGKSEYDEVKATGCAPSCGHREDAGRDKAIAGDAFMAAGLVTAIVATYLLVSRTTSTDAARAGERAPRIAVDVTRAGLAFQGAL